MLTQDGDVPIAIPLKVDIVELPALFRKDPTLLEKILEFFTAWLKSPNTKATYFFSIRRFVEWMEEKSLDFDSIRAPHIAKYIESLDSSIASKKMHLAAIRSLFNFLVSSGTIKSGVNPSHSVRGPSLTRKTGKTPYLSGDQVKSLLAAIEGDSLKSRRDKAIISTMLYTFARVGAVVQIKREDYYQMNKRFYLRLLEKGGKEHLLPVHHLAEETLDSYLSVANIKNGEFIFQGIQGKGRKLSGKALSRANVFDLIKNYAVKAGLNPKLVCCHSMRATGITTFLKNGGSLEEARKIANHADSRTTRLYDRRHQDVTVSEIERIRFD